jgi:hypothetical protein
LHKHYINGQEKYRIKYNNPTYYFQNAHLIFDMKKI